MLSPFLLFKSLQKSQASQTFLYHQGKKQTWFISFQKNILDMVLLYPSYVVLGRVLRYPFYHINTKNLNFQCCVLLLILQSLPELQSFCKKLGNWSIVQDDCGLIIELVSAAEIQMSSAWESFLKSNSRGIDHSAAIILHASKGSIQ